MGDTRVGSPWPCHKGLLQATAVGTEVGYRGQEMRYDTEHRVEEAAYTHAVEIQRCGVAWLN